MPKQLQYLSDCFTRFWKKEKVCCGRVKLSFTELLASVKELLLSVRSHVLWMSCHIGYSTQYIWCLFILQVIDGYNPSINFSPRVADGCITVCVKRFLWSNQNKNDFEKLWLYPIKYWYSWCRISCMHTKNSEDSKYFDLTLFLKTTLYLLHYSIPPNKIMVNFSPVFKNHKDNLSSYVFHFKSLRLIHGAQKNSTNTSSFNDKQQRNLYGTRNQPNFNLKPFNTTHY